MQRKTESPIRVYATKWDLFSDVYFSCSIHSFILCTKQHDKQETGKVKIRLKGGSPGLVVMGNDSCLRGCWFESERHILDGNFFIDTVLL